MAKICPPDASMTGSVPPVTVILQFWMSSCERPLPEVTEEFIVISGTVAVNGVVYRPFLRYTLEPRPVMAMADEDAFFAKTDRLLKTTTFTVFTRVTSVPLMVIAPLSWTRLESSVSSPKPMILTPGSVAGAMLMAMSSA